MKVRTKTLGVWLLLVANLGGSSTEKFREQSIEGNRRRLLCRSLTKVVRSHPLQGDLRKLFRTLESGRPEGRIEFFDQIFRFQKSDEVRVIAGWRFLPIQSAGSKRRRSDVRTTRKKNKRAEKKASALNGTKRRRNTC